MVVYCCTSDGDTPASMFNVVTTDTWKGKLDFERACTGPERRCWLCTELTPWNQVMHGLAFELVELRPGKLRLQPIRHGNWECGPRRANVAAEASCLVSWLLQHHRCIDDLRVALSVISSSGTEETAFPIRLRRATGSDSRCAIRGLEVDAYTHTWGDIVRRRYQLEDLDAVNGLETLKLQFQEMRPEFAAELSYLLRRNANSLKRLEIHHFWVPRQVNHALRYLLRCESLTCRRLPNMKSVVRLLLTSAALKKLTISHITSTRQVDAIARELETNTSLTKLCVGMKDERCSPVPVFTALQHNTTLKELRVNWCISGACEQALALLLQKNTGLRLLHIESISISQSSVLVLAAGLTRNTTLESLHLSIGVLSTSGIAELCKALRINKTLKELRFPDFLDPSESRDGLARQLAQDNCYGRVELPCSEPDLLGLTSALNSSSADIKEVDLPDLHSLSLAGLKQLFDALASNKSVRTLRVGTWGDPGEKGRVLCEILKVNWSIEYLDLTIHEDKYKFVEEVLYALAENAGVTKLRLNFIEIDDLKTVTALSYFLAHNEATTKFVFSFETRLSPEFVQEFSQGMLQNKIIVNARLPQNLIHDNVGFPLYEAVRRNRGALNRAVDFVVSPSLDRQCAEGFELFNGRPCLLKHLRKVTGKAEPEVMSAIAAAERYLRDNYLLITGIVRDSVKCHPAQGTQVDALNKHCWLSIVWHLKVSDVLP